MLPDGWRVSPVSFDATTRHWTIAGRLRKYSGRLRQPIVIRTEGEDEVVATTFLAYDLRKLGDGERLVQTEERARAAYLQGAEEHSRATLGRSLAQEELERMVRRYSESTTNTFEG